MMNQDLIHHLLLQILMKMTKIKKKKHKKLIRVNLISQKMLDIITI